MPSEIVPEEGGIVHLPPLTLGHIRAFIIERARLPPFISEGFSISGACLRGVHGSFLAAISPGGGLWGCRRGGGGSWGPCLPATLRGCCGLSPPLGLGLRWRACLGLGASLTLGTPLGMRASPALRGLLGSHLAGAHLSGPLYPYQATALTLPLGGRADRGACGGGGVPGTGGTGRCH